MRRMRAGAVAASVAAISAVGGVAMAAGPPGASTHQARTALSDPARSNVGAHSAATPVTRSVERARADLRDALGRDAVLTVDERTGGVKAVGRANGFLTGASSAGAADVALGWVRAHADALGLGAADIAGLK